jgi:uncharacterized membrane protein
MIESGSAVPAAVAGFLGSLVECVEALTVVLAVGAVRGWRSALGGAAAGLLVLALVLAIAGRALAAMPMNLARLAMGALLLVLGARWLRKAVRRAAGTVRKRDEIYAYAQTQAMLRGPDSQATGEAGGWNRAAMLAAAQVTLIEGIEVVFIVLSLAATGHALLAPVGIGAASAFVLVCAAGAILHRPLSTVPENTLKGCAAVLLCSFGGFSLGEGAGLAWPGGAWSIPGLAVLTGLGALLAIVVIRRQMHAEAPP